MRLIDADELLDGYKHMGYDPTEHPEDSHMEGWCKGFNAAVDHCMHHVIHAPTIIPERKRGRWLEKKAVHARNDERIAEWQSCKCSECGRYDTRPYMYYFDEPIFCPHCGAEMKGE